MQAIAIASCFMNEGSILVVCPAVLRIPWAEELERWLPLCSTSDIHLGNILSQYVSIFLGGLGGGGGDASLKVKV